MNHANIKTRAPSCRLRAVQATIEFTQDKSHFTHKKAELIRLRYIRQGVGMTVQQMKYHRQ